MPTTAAAGGGWRAAVVGACGNLSVQYNLQALSIALSFMTVNDEYPEPAWVKNTILGAVFAGTIVGMTGMGALGDAIGRRRAMLLTLALVVLGSLASAAAWGAALYPVIAAARFAIGVGVGGIYPLAAATAAESEGGTGGDDAGNDGDDAGIDDDDAGVDVAGRAAETAALAKRVGWAFFWQAPGAMLPYVVAWALLALPATTSDLTSVQFRLILGLGALPAAITFAATYASTESVVYIKAAAAAADRSPSWASTLQRHRAHLVPLAGTCLTWLLFDIACYGTNIFTPQILAAIFGSSESLFATCWQSLAIGLVGLPAVPLTIILMPRLGGKALSNLGFGLMAASFAALAVVVQLYPSPGDAANAKFAIFALNSFALNFGPNVMTYVLPAQLFPTAVRSRFHGASAASGKVGAVIGTFMYTPISSQFGLAAVMWVQVALCLLGGALSAALLPATPALQPLCGSAGATEEQDEQAAKLLDAR